MPWAVDKPERDEYNSDQYNVSYKDHGPIYIPLLSEVFTEVCPLGKQIIVELKGNRADIGPRVIQLAKDMDIVNCIHTFSTFHWSKFNPSRANEVDLLEPLKNETIIPKALLFKFRPEELLNPLKAAEYYNATALHTNCQLLWNDIEVRNQIFHRAQTGDIYDQKPNNEQYDSNSQKKDEFKLQRKLTTSCYFSAEYTDTVEELEKTIDMNVLDEICTNNPQLLRQILDQREFRRIEIDEEQSSEL
ncbi:MAG: hypothetical protein EZS28_043328 [Streblomastix strix]|uniref:Uncharacterized protein n=1 Tax=Streblomastix strix TaxID=222440 RepID=A0A5J4TUR6_9EUKA|nr:MAG: hypothetical protein EZS28_043328 [Streblomastix strix]